MSILKWLLSRSFVQSFATKEVRHLATAAAGAIASWLVAHQASQSDAANIAQALSALIAGAAGYGLSLLNAASNEARVQAAAATGQVVSAPQARAILAQSDAAAPTAKSALIADLEAGGPK
jgi:acyl-coenzyme A synthetase/AMP-(fatty) acid ligase